jgi:hypothetical protein
MTRRIGGSLVRVLLGALLAGGVLAQPADDDEEFPAADLPVGTRTTREQCEATRDAVWVAHQEGTECIRYFPSSNVTGARQAALFFHGDLLEGRFVIAGAYRNNRASVMRREAEGLARVNGVPYILVGRPGTYGSSGRHTERRLLKEYLSLNAAVDAIKARHGLESVLLSGQSGGATSVAALLTLGRTDVVCAAASSGGYNALARARDIASEAGRSWNGCDAHGMCGPYNATDHVDGVQKSAQRRIFIIGDPSDSNTRFKYQQAFADKLRAAGHDVTLVDGQGRGPKHHGLAHMAARTLGWCNAGYDSQRIAALVHGNALALHAPAPGPKPLPEEE